MTIQPQGDDQHVTGDARTHGMPLRPDDPRHLGPYELRSRLGEGGMGVVYLAAGDDGRLVAVKLIRADLADQPEFRRRFRSEVTRARQVPPFCTAEVLDADPDHDTPYLVVEFVDGPSLSEVVLDTGPLTPSNLHGLAIGVATALTAIHGAGVIHRDLKPSNVLLAPGSPKVIDFGIARDTEGGDGETRTDQLIGTVAYMAPERLDPRPGQPLTAAADIFAWGAVVAFAASGWAPFHADSSPATAVAILTQEPALDGVGEPLRSVVARALAKDPADRPTARALLDQLLSNDVTVATPAVATPAVATPAVATPKSGVRADEARLNSGAAAAQVDLDTQPRPPAQPTRAEDAPPDTHMPAPRPRPPLRRRVGIGALVVALVAMAVTLAGILHGDIKLPVTAGLTGTTAGAGATPTTTSSASAAMFPGRATFIDSLAAPGNWIDASQPKNFDSTCEVHNGLVVSIGGASSFRCPGYVTNLRDFKLAVDVTLLRAGSCASVWFHFVGHDGPQHGYALLICESGASLRTHTNATADGGDLIATSDASVWAPLPVGVTTHIELSVVSDFATVDRDGVPVLRSDAGVYQFGRVVLGIFQPSPRHGPTPSAPPEGSYSVRFNNIQIWLPEQVSGGEASPAPTGQTTASGVPSPAPSA